MESFKYYYMLSRPTSIYKAVGYLGRWDASTIGVIGEKKVCVSSTLGGNECKVPPSLPPRW